MFRFYLVIQEVDLLYCSSLCILAAIEGFVLEENFITILEDLGELRYVPLAVLCFMIFIFILPVFCVHISTCFRSAKNRKGFSVAKRSNVYEIESDVSDSFDRSLIDHGSRISGQSVTKDESSGRDKDCGSIHIETS